GVRRPAPPGPPVPGPRAGRSGVRLPLPAVRAAGPCDLRPRGLQRRDRRDPGLGPVREATPGRRTATVRERLRAGAVRVAEMPVESWLSLAVVLVCMVFVVINVGGSNLLSDTTPAGGDMGAHVWGPAYMRDELLPRGRLTGWTM